MNCHLQRKVDLLIHQDWDKLRKTFNALRDKQKTNLLKSTPQYIAAWEVWQYNFGNAGCLVINESLSREWRSWMGLGLYWHLPWKEQAYEFFSELDLAGIAWSVTSEPVKKHVDGKIDSESENSQCKINYIVRCDDPNAKTFSYENLQQEESNIYYPSIENNAYLLNVEYPHSVESNGYREIIQFKFNETFETVATFLDDKGPIVFGNPR